MKLLARYNRVNIAATILVLLVGGLCYYFILRFVLIHQLDKDLKIEEQEVKDYVQHNSSLPNAANYKDQKVVFEPAGSGNIKRKIYSVNLYDTTEDEQIQGRRLIFIIENAGKNYKVSITKSQQETEDLIQLIVLLTLAIVVLLLVVLFIINRFVLNKLWLPFNNTLQQLKQFNLSNKSAIKLEDSNINEFKELNSAVTTMSNSVIKDYDALKSFTENASHEIQTPLAVINSKLELLMQAENFSEIQMQYIQHIQEEISRLSKLNQSLLLLTKIDNQQFKDTEHVDIANIVAKHLNNYEELIAAKEITLTQNIDAACIVSMNKIMAEILVSNLITNAIKHNIKNGAITITSEMNRLTVSNTGTELKSNPDELFERFRKDKVNSESLGLGLSIVKKICEQYNYKAVYEYANGLHTIAIEF
ncbi:sensor histidine kinase [Ferruginibacter sp. SUN106]|uniref:sensor histidine kinase n=1 Tax=Ferruginibacter sp. SUN106 TaxID=2978348 RepID=UPI003D35B8D7